MYWKQTPPPLPAPKTLKERISRQYDRIRWWWHDIGSAVFFVIFSLGGTLTALILSTTGWLAPVHNPEFRTVACGFGFLIFFLILAIRAAGMQIANAIDKNTETQKELAKAVADYIRRNPQP